MAQSPSSSDPYASIGQDDPYAAIGADPYAQVGDSPYAAIIAESQDFQRRAARNTPENIGREVATPPINDVRVPTGFGGTIEVPQAVSQFAPLAAKIVPPIATAVGLGSGVGTLPTIAALLAAGGTGEFLGQSLEKELGQREDYSLAEGALNTALTPVTVGPLRGVSSPLVRAGIRGLEGAGLTAVQDVGTRAIRGDEQNLGETLRASTFGGVLGSGIGLGEFARGRTLGQATQGGLPTELIPVGRTLREPVLPEPTALVPDELAMIAAARGDVVADEAAAMTAAQEAASQARIRALGERMMGKTPDEQLSILDQEMRLQKDYLTPAEQRAGLDLKQELQRQIDAQNLMQEAAFQQRGINPSANRPVLAEQFARGRLEDNLSEIRERQLAGDESMILTGEPAEVQLMKLNSRLGEQGAVRERARLQNVIDDRTPEAPADVAIPTLSAQAQRMMDQYGRTLPGVIAPVAGAGAGGVAGFTSTERMPGETDEQFQARRLANAALGAAGVAGVAGLATSSRVRGVLSRMTGKPPKAQLDILNQEVKLAGDTLTQAEQRVALDTKIQLQSQIDAEKAAQASVRDMQAAAKAQQQKALTDVQEAATLPVPEPPKSTQIVEEVNAPKSLANTAAIGAKQAEGNLTQLQTQINEMAVAGPRLAEPAEAVAPLTPAVPPTTKAQAITAAVEDPETVWQFTVFRPGDGIPDAIQVDAIQGGRNTVSSNPADLRKAGGQIPDVPEWVPQGKYTLDEVNAFIESGPPRGPTEVEEIRATVTPEPTPEGRPASATRAASIRRQQRGAVPASVLAPIGGAASGATTGYAVTERREGETEEEFQVRRLRNAITGGVIGAGATTSATSLTANLGNKAKARTSTLQSLQQEAIGRELMPDWYLRLRQSPTGTAIREAVNNSRARVKDLVANISKDVALPDEQNPYLAGKLFPGRVSERVRQAEETMRGVQDNVVTAAKASGLSVDDFVKRFDLWMEARHTPYYNAALRERHEGPGPVPQHRFTDEQAAEILQETGSNGFARVFDDLSKEYSGITDATRDILVKGGIIDQNTADAWRKQYPFYAPFNRVLPDDSLELAANKFVGGGPGLNVIGTGVYKIKGSDLPVADIGGSIYANMLDAVRRVEKNRVDQSALNFFQGPGKGTVGVNVRSPKFGEVFDPNTMVAVRKQGDRYVIEFSDPKLATAFSNLNPENASGLLKLISYPTRWYSGLVTRFSPNFLAANPVRDRQEAALKLASQGDWSGAASMLSPKKAIYNDPKTVVDWVRGADNPEAALFQQMLDDGGMAGGFASSTRKMAQDAVKEFRVSDVNPVVGAKDKFIKFVDFLTDISEGSTRFRAYKRALESGATRDQAALAARNVSVDFNQKGTITPQAAALWSFFNPAVQGPINSAKALIRKPETIATIAAAFVGTGALIDSWNSSFDPDWKKKPSFQFSRTTGMPVIYGVDEKTGELLTFNFPVAHSLRPIKATMDFFMDASNGEIDQNNLPNELARVGGAVMDSTNPLGSGSIKTAWAPTVSRPALEMWLNEKFTGSPIVPKWMEADPLVSDRAKRYLTSYDSNTGKMANEMSDMLAEQFGADVSPERMRYLIRQYSGGPGRVIADMVNSSPKAIKALAGSGDINKIRLSEAPVSSAFFRRINPELSERESPVYKQTEEYVRGVNTDEELRRQQARLFFRDTVEPIPVEQREQFLSEADAAGHIPADPVYRSTLLNRLRSDARGRDQTDSLITNLGVDSGERAKYYATRLREMTTDEEANEFLRDQATKGLLNEKVYQQLLAMPPQP